MDNSNSDQWSDHQAKEEASEANTSGVRDWKQQDTNAAREDRGKGESVVGGGYVTPTNNELPESLSKRRRVMETGRNHVERPQSTFQRPNNVSGHAYEPTMSYYSRLSPDEEDFASLQLQRTNPSSSSSQNLYPESSYTYMRELMEVDFSATYNAYAPPPLATQVEPRESASYEGLYTSTNGFEATSPPDTSMTTLPTCCDAPCMVSGSIHACQSCGNEKFVANHVMEFELPSCCELPKPFIKEPFDGCLECREASKSSIAGNDDRGDMPPVSTEFTAQAIGSSCCLSPFVEDEGETSICYNCGADVSNGTSLGDRGMWGEDMLGLDFWGLNHGIDTDEEDDTLAEPNNEDEDPEGPFDLDTVLNTGLSRPENVGYPRGRTSGIFQRHQRLCPKCGEDVADDLEDSGPSYILVAGQLQLAQAEEPKCPHCGTVLVRPEVYEEYERRRLKEIEASKMDSKKQGINTSDQPARILQIGPAPKPPPPRTPLEPPVRFPKFPKLPAEIRDRVYHFVLASHRSIVPHLCDVNEFDPSQIRFHDEHDPSGAHDGAYDRMAITRVCRAVRRESLPIFYSANTFAVCDDLLTYFERLDHLGRFHMIRNVTFTIDFSHEMLAPKALRTILQTISEQETYEKLIIQNNLEFYKEGFVQKPLNQVRWNSKVETTRYNNWPYIVPDNVNPTPPSPPEPVPEDTSDEPPYTIEAPPLEPFTPDLTRFYADSRTKLVLHPQHITGGLPSINTFLVLRKLASEFTSTSPTSSPYSHKLVLHVPTSSIFTEYDTLAYFPAICEGLGIKLHFVDGRDVECANGGIKVSWHQKYQKKEFEETAAEGEQEKGVV